MDLSFDSTLSFATIRVGQEGDCGWDIGHGPRGKFKLDTK